MFHEFCETFITINYQNPIANPFCGISLTNQRFESFFLPVTFYTDHFIIPFC